jgi:tRNA threonylcarbamoyladenosine biosynthesis protein TsaB
MANRLVLGIDNSVDFLNLALSLEEKLIEERHIKTKRAPSEIISVEALQMLASHGYTPDDVEVLVATLGPGSFTGIRIGLSFCKGMSAPRNTSLIGVPTLDVLAAPFSFMEGHYLCPLLDAKKGEVFLSLYHVAGGVLNRLTGYQSIKPPQVPSFIKTPCLLFGTGAALCEPFFAGIDGVTIIKDTFSRISGEALIREGLRQSATGELLEVKPIYGRRSEAEIKFNVQLV